MIKLKEIYEDVHKPGNVGDNIYANMSSSEEDEYLKEYEALRDGGALPVWINSFEDYVRQEQDNMRDEG